MVPQIIVNGISLPFGFIVGPTENNSIYKCFYNELIKTIGSDYKLKLLPILSDHGTGIEILQRISIRSASLYTSYNK